MIFLKPAAMPDSHGYTNCCDTLIKVIVLSTFLPIYFTAPKYPEYTVEKNMTFSSINVVPNRIFHKIAKKVFMSVIPPHDT